MGITVRRITNQENDFYKIMGRFLARRNVDKELGGRLYNDDGAEWFVALDEKKTAGFCCAKPMKNRVLFCHDYVVDCYRNKGVYKKLFVERLRAFQGCPISAICNKNSLQLYLSQGFTILRKKGSFTEVIYGQE